MKLRTRIIAALLLLCTLVTLLPTAALAAFAVSGDKNQTKEDAMEQIKADTELAKLNLGQTQTFPDDGVIGIPYEITVYYDHEGRGSAVPGYMTCGATPVILYVVNAGFERIGTHSDVDIINSMLERGYAVAVLDYKNNGKATGEALDFSAQGIRKLLSEGEYFTDKSIFPEGTYQDNIIVPAGYNVRLNDVFFELDKHGTDGTLEKIVNVWNNDFRMYKKDTVIKWVHSDGSRKATQNGFDGSSPVWYSDAEGKTVDAENGTYIKVNHTLAGEITDCVKADGTPLDLNLYVHVLYPTDPLNEVPVMTMLSSAGYLMTGSNNVERPQMQGFLFRGYAGILYDYAWIPMGRNDHYGYFDGSSGAKSVTGDNQSYATYTFNAAQSSTAALRYARYLALTEPETYKFDVEKFGNFGISKAASNTHLGAEILSQLLTGSSKAETDQLVNDKINSFFQQLYLPGHHGETRYDNGKTESYSKDGYVIDGGELQPWASYNNTEICSGAQMVYSSCGAALDYVTEGFAPQFITVNINDTYNHGYNMQNILTNLCRVHDIPALWYEAEIAHTFAHGVDFKYGVNIYEAFMLFADYYLKDSSVRVTYTDPVNGSVISAGGKLTVKFIGEVRAEEIVKVTVKDGSGKAVNGRWESAFGDTEWTFTPADMQGGKTYTLTVPTDMVGANGKAVEEAYTASFYTLPEVSTSFDMGGASVTADTDGVFLSCKAPALTDGNNVLKLRLNVENAAVNKLSVYKASSATDKSGALIGTVSVSGTGIYELDVTDHVMSAETGSDVFFFVKTAKSEGNEQTFSEEFASGTGKFSKGDYSEYSNVVFDGEDALKIVRVTNEGKFGGEHYYYSTSTVFSGNKLIKDGQKLTKDDMGRTFLIKIRIYDTVSRSMRFQLNHLTDKNTGVFDYDRCYHIYWTKAGEWTEFTIPYTVYEAEYGVIDQVKKLTVQANATGDTEMPFYVDSVTVCEVFTDVTLTAASLVASAEGDFEYKKPSTGNLISVGDNTYATWKDAISNAPDGSTVKLLGNYVLTDSDLVSLGSKTSLTVDLNGYRLTAANTKNSPIWISATSNAAASFTVKNGRVILGDTPLVSYEGSNAQGSGKNVSVTLDNVYLSVADNSMLRSLITAESGVSGVKINASVTLRNCLIDITRNDLPDRAVKLFSTGDGNVRVSYTLEGGSLKADSMHEISFCAAVVNGAEYNGEFFRIYLSEGAIDTPIASITVDGDFYVLSRSETEGGYAVYTVAKAAHSTEYGAIPDAFADEKAYPFIVFANGVYIGNATSYKVATTVALNYVSEHPGDTVTVLMRADHVNTSSPEKLWQFNGKLVIDLGGHTLVRSSTTVEGMVEEAYAGGYDTDLVIKNGVMLSRSGHFIAFENASNYDKTYNIDFEGVTFALESGSTSGYLMTRCWGTNGDGITTVNMTLNDCVFDFTGKTEGSGAPASALKIFEFSKEKIVGNVKVYGGEIHASDAAIKNVTWSSSPNATDSVEFEKDASGSYVTLSVPNGIIPTATLPTKDGDFSFTQLVSDGAEIDVYTLKNDTVSTKYGAIPAANADNTFALFMNGKFFKGVNDWNAANKAARQQLDANPGASVIILMRKDHTSNGNIETASRICFMNGSVLVDLGGNKLISNKTLFEGGVPATYTASYDTSYSVINGFVMVGAGNVFPMESRGNSNKKIEVVFNDVTFGIDTATFNTSRNKVFFSYGDQAAYTGINVYDLEFNDCTFDFTGISVAMNIFKFDSANNVRVNVSINGGNIKAPSLDQLKLGEWTYGISSVVFGKGENNAYTVMTLPKAYQITKFGGVNDQGKGVIFANGVVDGDNKVYTLSENADGTEYGIIPDSAGTASENPFVLFNNKGGYVNKASSWGAALEAAKSYLGKNSGKTVYVVMRADHSNTANAPHLGTLLGNVVVDLNGFTLTRGSGKSLIEAATKNMTEEQSLVASSITVKNGTILALNTSTSNSGHIVTYQSYVNYDTTMDLTFDGVTFAVSDTYTESKGIYSVVVRSWGASNGATGVINSTLTFRDCVFDFSGSNGTAVPTSTKVVSVSGGKTSSNVNVIFEGGQYKGTLSGISLVELDNSDSVKFTANNGKYFEYFVNGSTKPSDDAITTDKGTMYFGKVSHTYINNVRWETFVPGVKSAECGNVIIPYQYTDKQTYPYVVTQNGGFVAAKKTWGEALNVAANYLDNEGDTEATVTVYLVRDVRDTSTATQLSRIRGKLIIDLGGYTLTATKTLFEAEAQHTHKTTVEVRNGNIIIERSGSGAIIAFNRNNTVSGSDYRDTAHKDFYLSFTDVTFSVKSGATSKNPIAVLWKDDSKSALETVTVYLTFTDCTFDMTNAPSGAVLFDYSRDSEFISVNTLINGGKVILGNANGFAFAKNANPDSTLKFDKYDGSYTLLQIRSGNAPAGAFDTVSEGKATFKPTANAGEYVLVPCDHGRVSDYKNDGENHYKECLDCGTVTEIGAHEGGKATCCNGKICSVCELEYGSADSDAHASADVWTVENAQHWKECLNGCGSKLELGSCDGVATCVSAAVCTVCNTAHGDVDGTNHDTEGVTEWFTEGDGHFRICNCLEKINEGEHSASEWNVTENGHSKTCTVCGFDYAQGEHSSDSWVSENAEHHKVCQICLGIYAEGVCQGGEATCGSPAVCDTCGNFYGNVDENGHVADGEWQSDGVKHWKICSVDGCGAKLYEEACYGGYATCTDKAVCSVCENEYGDYAYHTYSGDCDGMCDHPDCGYEREASASHKYQNKCDATCDVCREKRNVEHSYANACDATCDVCYAERTVSGHVGGTATCVKRAVCTSCGTEYGEYGDHFYDTVWSYNSVAHFRKCACGAIKDEAEHTFGEAVDGKISCICGYTLTVLTDSDKNGMSGTHAVAVTLGTVAVFGGIGAAIVVFISKKKKLF